MATAEVDEVTLDEVAGPAGALAGISKRSAAIHLRHFLNVVNIKLEGHDGDNELVFNHEWTDPVMAVFLDNILLGTGEPEPGSPHWLLERHLGLRIVYSDPTEEAMCPSSERGRMVFCDELPSGDARRAKITHFASDAVLLAA